MAEHQAKSHVLLVTSQALFRECLQVVIKSELPQVQVAFADGCTQAYLACEQNQQQLVIFDLNGIQDFTPAHTLQFTQRFESADVLIVGKRDQERLATAFLEAGASDFRLAESESATEFCGVIDRALRGETHCSPDRTRAIFARLQQLSREISKMNALDNMVLTEREMEILQFVDEGKSNKQIATALHISLHTVKNHVHRILDKLQVNNRREAVRHAYDSGWLKMQIR